MIRHNLHIHSTYSDGDLRIKEVLTAAREADLAIIGISDHAFTRKLPEHNTVTSDLKSYIDDLQSVKTTVDCPQIYVGLEIDVSCFFGISPAQLPFEVLNQLFVIN